MAVENNALLHALDLTFFDLPSSASIRLEFPIEAGAVIPMAVTTPSVRLGASFGDGEMTIGSFSIGPRRIEFDIENAPAKLPLVLQVICSAPFLHGWLQVPGNVQALIGTAAQRIRFVGPGYWALPLVQPEGDPKPAPKPAPTPAPAPAPTPTPSSTKPSPTPSPKPTPTPAAAPSPSTPTPTPASPTPTPAR